MMTAKTMEDKVKYIWEEKDIENMTGRMVCKPSAKDFFKPDGWTAKWTFQIGYANGTGEKLCLISITDGMISQIYTPKELAALLNKDEMIPMPYSWHLATLEFLRRD
jgi:hypothetical protein